MIITIYNLFLHFDENIRKNTFFYDFQLFYLIGKNQKDPLIKDL